MMRQDTDWTTLNKMEKEYFCFVCGAKSSDRGLPLLLSETTYSHICLGQKLQEILGDKLIVLIKPRDSVCWNCAEVINWVDKYEIRIDIAKDNLTNQIIKKYKKIEMCLRSESSDYFEKDFPAPSNDEVMHENETNKSKNHHLSQVDSKGLKKKTFPCSVCHKLYATAAAAGAHAAKVHRQNFTCEYCDKIFSSEKKYKNHLYFHDNVTNVENSKLLSCVSCGFKTTNTEVYCRHVCNSAIMSLTCMTCKRRYVDSSMSKGQTLKYQCKDCKKQTDEPEEIPKKIEKVQSINVPESSVITEKTEFHSEMAEFFHSVESSESPQPPADDVILEEEPVTIIQNGVTNEELSVESEKQTEEITVINRECEIEEEEEEKNIITTLLESDITIHEDTGDDGNLTDNMTVTEETEVMSKNSDFIINQSYLKCTNCGEEFELSQLASHQCFVRGDVVEFAEVERQVEHQYYTVPFFKPDEETNTTMYETQKPAQRRRRIPKIPAQENSYINLNDNMTKMNCKTCGAEFKTIGLMRQHWDLTGHLREVSTTTIELNKIKDKTRKTEKTFKVVKQNFHIRANVPGQNDDEIRKNEEVQMNCIVKFKNDMSVEDFIGMKGGKECETCGILFGSEDVLKEHQQNNCLTCVTCNVTFLDNKLLRKHYQYTGHANRIPVKGDDQVTLKTEHESFSCHVCFKTFYSRFILGKHLQKHYKGTSKGACRYCQMEFEDKSHIQQHVLEVHGAQLYKCQHCDRTFLSESVRNRHQIKHKMYTCKTCKIKFPTQRLFMSHLDQAHRNSFSCVICGKVIQDLQALKRHEKMHFYGKNLQCDLCGKTFRSKAILKAHSTVHQNEPHFKCKYCGLGFKTAENLEEHQIIHIKKEYTCPKCSVICPSRIFFWVHMKLHDTAYMCSVCGRTFRDTSLLAVHRRKHWRVRPYQCPHCPRVFSVPATLRRHLTVHTRAFPHRCVLCKKGFLTRYAFHKHLDTVHSVRQSQPRRQEKKIPSLPLNATDEDLFQAADTLISDDTIMFNDYTQKDMKIEQVSSNDLTTNEVVVETTELFDVLP
ncbi:zinc finger protein 91-like [Cimex lectularius]|uniref:C2H2-type domain-containing protein n=1 Tax=Cimex lectularius TaxID=79782 RepID=A0A8I6SI46_CIMLE|nr:zinc finger protein 91-like [Cimex lectularius]XP_024082340.1 zinc finger protein 91-like [Cimex lectularius]